MAKIWAVYEGREPTIGGPWARLPLLDAVSLFDLRHHDHVADISETPRFGDVNRDLTYAGIRYIVVEVDHDEAQGTNWMSGFYKSRVTPKETVLKLIQHALVAELGDGIVERLKFEPTTDSQGREALKITVVIAPGATERLSGSEVQDHPGGGCRQCARLDCIRTAGDHGW